MGAVRASFRPEFLNRLDETLVFEPLSKSELGQIVDLQLAGMARRLVDRRLTFMVTPVAREWLADEGYDPVYGARPLRRLVQREIGDRLARLILSGEVADGQEVVADVSDDVLAGLSLTAHPDRTRSAASTPSAPSAA